MASVFDAQFAYVNRLVRKQLQTKFISSRPLLWFLANESQSGLDFLLKPRNNPNENWQKGVILGGASMGLSQRETLDGSLGVEVRNQKATPTASSFVAPGGATPVSSVFSEDLVGTAEYRWTTSMIPLKIRKSTEDMVKNGAVAIGKPLEEAVGMSTNQFFSDSYTNMWQGTLTQTQQNQVEWSNGMLGMTHMVDDGTTYQYVGRVDRLVETYLKATVNSAASLVSSGYLASTQPSLGLIPKLRTINSIGGLANRDPDGGNLCITTPELFNVLRDEAEGQHIVYEDVRTLFPNSTGTLGTVGMQYPVIKKDKTLITYDPLCPAGELYLLSTGSFLYQIQSGYNYKLNPWQYKYLNEEGGGHYVWTLIELKHRLACLRHDLNLRVTGLTTT